MYEITKLLEAVKDYSPVAVAFSGGVDSSVMAQVAYLANSNSIAVLVEDPSVSQAELNVAKDVANKIGIKFIIAKLEKRSEDYLRNDQMRCYFCKSQVYREVKKVADFYNIKTILDGTNADDVNDFRPGMKAAQELEVKSPLLDLGISKKQVREMALEFGLPNHDKPSNPCLSSRIMHGIRVDASRLKRVENAESFISGLLNIQILRVRDHGDTARIEVAKNELGKFNNEETMQTIDLKLKELGFREVVLDLDGYKSKSV
ncbi:ATP-dependent sacrificial sulfur transferase LarE [Candidatus Micrarchaeota archaeon]|nr:ATP-dependent sacrificial sulfur transferase LarE [Candidatus Micrarchaeota archaeon]